MATVRIATGGIQVECSTFNPLRTYRGDFTVTTGEALIHRDAAWLYDGFPHHEFFGLLHARALPGGPVNAQAYADLKTDFLHRLHQSLPVDAVLLKLHGAMQVDGSEDAEGDFVAAVREAVGPDVLIGVSYDLHGNLSQRVVDHIDVFTAYRTAPHLDEQETLHKALSMLDRALTDRLRPTVAFARVPVLLPGERTSTVDEPARSLYAKLPDDEEPPGVMDASLLVGYVWADEPRATAAAVVTGTDPAALQRTAASLAEAYFAARHDFKFGTFAASIHECLDRAETLTSQPIVLADSGDNPTAGGVGDRTDVLRALIARGLTRVLVAGIADRPAVDHAFAAGEGRRTELWVGSTLDPAGCRPVTGHAEIVRLVGQGTERQAVVRLGGITVVLAARRRPYHHLADFTTLGLDPRRFRLIVVKSGYLAPELAELANPPLLALSPGVVDQDIARLPSRRLRRPMFPFDTHFDFTPQPILSARAGRG